MNRITIKILALIIALLILQNPLSSKDKDNLKKGFELFSEKKFDEAIEYLSKAINKKKKLDKKNIEPYYYRGLCYVYKQMPQQAIADFTSVINIDNRHADAYNSRGLTYTYIDNLDSAMADFNKAIEIDSQFSEAYLNRGSIYVVWLNYDAALDDFTNGLKYKPDNAELYYQRGVVYYKKKKLEEAIADFTKSLEFGIKTPKVYFSRGNTYYKLEKYKEAIEDYTKAIKLNPNDTEALNNRAMAYTKLGDSNNAENDRQRLSTMIKKAPDYIPIDSLKFYTYKDSVSNISIDLPENWSFLAYHDSNLVHIIISLNKIESFDSPYSIGVSLVYNYNMEKLFGVKTNEQILEFWKGSSSKNSLDYYNYEIFSQKIKNYGDYYGFLNKSRIVVKEDIPPFRLYEFVLSKAPALFYGYFQSPEESFGYYQQIFDKAIETLKLP